MHQSFLIAKLSRFFPFFIDKCYSSVEAYRLIFGLVIFFKVPYVDLIID